MNYYQDNLSYLDERLKGRLGVITIARAIVEPSKKGEPTLKVIDRKEKAVSIHSPYDPRSEAKKILSQYELENKKAIIVLGFGLGYLAEEICSVIKEDTELVVIDPNLDLFKVALETRDMTGLLKSPHLRLLIGEENGRIIDYLGEIITLDRLELVQVIEHRPSLSLEPAYYRKVMGLIKGVLEAGLMNLASLSSFGMLWQENILDNIPEIISNPPLDSLFGKFPDQPAIIISAGPSLDKNIQDLAMARGKALLISVDTALKAVLKRGIKPDIVITVDAQVKNYHHFRGLDLNDVALVADSVCYPRIFKHFSGLKLIASHGHILMDWIMEYLREEPYISLKGGGSVATYAFDLARKIGADPIIFVGQDLSFPDNRAFVSGGSYEEQWAKELAGRAPLEMKHREYIGDEFIWRKDIYGQSVPTHKKLAVYQEWFHWEIARTKATCINATQGGILKEGVLIMDLAEAIDQYCQAPLDIKGILEEAEIYRPKPQLERLRRDIRTIIQEAFQVKDICEEALGILRDNSDYRRLNEINNQINQAMSTRLISGSIQGVLQRLRPDKGLDVTRDKEKLHYLYQAVAKASHSLGGVLGQVVKKI
ncbi:MAG: 6-hydroxymethylpterin diphosphokinase MptE-like protein [bacterium]